MQRVSFLRRHEHHAAVTARVQTTERYQTQRCQVCRRQQDSMYRKCPSFNPDAYRVTAGPTAGAVTSAPADWQQMTSRRTAATHARCSCAGAGGLPLLLDAHQQQHCHARSSTCHQSARNSIASQMNCHKSPLSSPVNADTCNQETWPARLTVAHPHDAAGVLSKIA